MRTYSLSTIRKAYPEYSEFFTVLKVLMYRCAEVCVSETVKASNGFEKWYKLYPQTKRPTKLDLSPLCSGGLLVMGWILMNGLHSPSTPPKLCATCRGMLHFRRKLLLTERLLRLFTIRHRQRLLMSFGKRFLNPFYGWTQGWNFEALTFWKLW